MTFPTCSITRNPHLFLVDEAQCAEEDSKIDPSAVCGDMPRNSKVGYLFAENAGGQASFNRTVAHELGHGAFAYEHPFDNAAYKTEQGATRNLMDYVTDDDLAYFQWQSTLGLNLTWGFLEGDESGMMWKNIYWFGDNEYKNGWVPDSEENLDEDQSGFYLELLDPTFRIGERRVRRLMRMMNIHASYPSPRLSTLGSATYVYPYLLRKMNIERPNQVWSTDISYIPMGKGFLYLYAIIDVHSRYIVSWGLYSTLEASNTIEVLERAIRRHGVPEILNSDQGSQYTCKEWEEALERYGIKISMDGRGRCKDNIWIERFWRTIKNEYIYFHPFDDGVKMREGIRWYIDYYNNQRHHQGIGHKTPKSLYLCGGELPKVA